MVRPTPVLYDQYDRKISASSTTQDIANGWGGTDSYKGASTTRRQGALWNPGLGSADAEISDSLPSLRARSSDLVRNVPLAAGALDTLESHVIGSGLYCQPNVNAEVLGITPEQAQELEDQFKREFILWGSTLECDVTRKSTFEGVQQLAFRSWHERGDVGVSLPMFERPGSLYETKVQLIEADRIDNPWNKGNSETLVNGVEMTPDGAPIGYHIRKHHPGAPWITSGFMESIYMEAFGKKTGRRNMWLLSDESRVGQTRGIPYLAVALELFKQVERYTDAELSAAIVGGSFTVFIKSEDGEFMPLASTPFGSTTTEGFGELDYALDYGAIVPLKPGQSIEQANPQRPNRVFGDFVRAILEQIGTGLGLPFEIL